MSLREIGCSGRGRTRGSEVPSLTQRKLPSRMLSQTFGRWSALSIAMVTTLLIDAPPPAAAAAQPEVRELSRAEKTIAAHVDAHSGEARALLQRVVDVNSGTQNLAGVREVGKVFMGELD